MDNGEEYVTNYMKGSLSQKELYMRLLLHILLSQMKLQNILIEL
jgi:hypothetical protein